MHPVLILTRNNLSLTKRAIQSVFEQRISVDLYAVDNGSSDGTQAFLKEMGFWNHCNDYNAGVSAGWNEGLRYLFEGDRPADHVLVINNDLVLPEFLYAALLSYDVPFVTGVAVDKMPGTEMPERMPLTPNPDFSCFLITKQAWFRIGEFNERMCLYASDADYHVRGHRLGVGMFKANVPYYHERSSTMNNASAQDQAVIRAQAEADRGQFRAIYGCAPGDAAYGELFK